MATKMINSTYILISALLIVFFTNNNVTAQPQHSFLDFDSIAFQNTIKYVYQTWENSQYSKDYEIDTILCAFILRFDTLNLRKAILDEELLLKSVLFSLHENNYYKCECEIYNTDLDRVATFGIFDDYYVFYSANYNFLGSEYLKERIMNYGDMVFIPQSKGHAFNFKWRLILTNNNELKWMNTDNPSLLYNFSEFQQSDLEPLILGD